MADLRAQVTAQQSQQTESVQKAQRLQRAYENSRARGPGASEKPRRRAKETPALRGQDSLPDPARKGHEGAVLERAAPRNRGGCGASATGLVISIASAILFKSGSAKIRSGSKALLVKFSNLLRRYANREVQVQGHTDNVQISDRLAERWEDELGALRRARHAGAALLRRGGQPRPAPVFRNGNGRVPPDRRQRYTRGTADEQANRNRHLPPRFLRGELLLAAFRRKGHLLDPRADTRRPLPDEQLRRGL